MKNLLLPTIFFSFCLLLSCEKEAKIASAEQSAYDRSFTLTHTKFDFSMDVYFSDDNMLPLNDRQMTAVTTYFKKVFPDRPFDKVLQFESLLLEGEATDPLVITLVLQGELEERMRVPLAIEFHVPQREEGDPGLRYHSTGIATTTHSCSGDPCNCCIFLYVYVPPRGRNIAGCQCILGPVMNQYCNGDDDSHCNHTITTTI
jgi:hypothetical protein